MNLFKYISKIKLKCCFIFLFLFSLTAYSQKYYVPDNNFRACLQFNYPSFFVGDSLWLDSAAQTILATNVIPNVGVDNALVCNFNVGFTQTFSNIDGLRFFTHLKYLQLDAQPVENIEEINSLDLFDLTVNLSKSNIYPDLELFSNLRYLKTTWVNNKMPTFSNSQNILELYIQSNSLSNRIPFISDTLTISNNLKNLIWLGLSGTDVKYIALKDTLFELDLLSIQRMNIEEIDLNFYPNISDLWLSDNMLSDLNLSNNDSLTSVYARSNQLESVILPVNKEKLLSINFNYNQLQEIPSLKSYSNLFTIEFSNNFLKVLPELPDSIQAYSVDFSNNFLNDISETNKFLASDEIYLMDVSNNKLDFSDADQILYLDSIVNTSLTSSKIFKYAPQKPFGEKENFLFEQNTDTSISIAFQKYALNYQWFKDGVAIEGATDTILKFTYTQPFDKGVYTCKSFGTVLENMNFGNGIAEFVSEKKIVTIENKANDNPPLNVYPNPAFSNVTLLYYVTTPNSKVKIEIFDMLGRRHFYLEENQTRGKYLIPFNIEDNSFRKGLYFFRYTENNNVFTKKFMVLD